MLSGAKATIRDRGDDQTAPPSKEAKVRRMSPAEASYCIANHRLRERGFVDGSQKKSDAWNDTSLDQSPPFLAQIRQ